MATENKGQQSPEWHSVQQQLVAAQENLDNLKAAALVAGEPGPGGGQAAQPNRAGIEAAMEEVASLSRQLAVLSVTSASPVK